MISVHEQNTIFIQANDVMLAKNKLIITALLDKAESQVLQVNEDASVEGFDPGKIYFIKQGVLAAYFQDTELYMLQDGDIFLPEFIPETPSDENKSDFNYTIKFALHVQVFTPSQLSAHLDGHADAIQLWIEITSLQQFLCHQTMAALAPAEQRPTPTFESISAGDTIIHEDDDAEYVFTLMEGRAIVVHNDVQVGVIEKDEIFGAIAVLLNQKRIATVKAEKDCMLLKVHQDEFSKMVHSHPSLFLSLLENLAESVKNLNVKVSELSTNG
jgi:hypothetical protein